MDSMQPLHGRPSAASVEAGMISMETTEPVEAVGFGDSDDVLLKAVDAHETVDKIAAAHDDEIEKSSAVDVGGMEAIVVQDNGTEASHGTTMEDISMDERAAIVEGTETCQGELTIEDGSVGNGTTDADGAQARGVKGVSDVQGAQVVGGNGSMVSGSIVGAGSQLGAAESEATGATSVVEADGIPRPGHWATLTKGQKKNWKKWHKWNGLYEPS
jgi:hypothetical protein